MTTGAESHILSSPIGPVRVIIDPHTLDQWSCLPAPEEVPEEVPLLTDLQSALSLCRPLPSRYRIHQASPAWAPHFWDLLSTIRSGQTITYGQLCQLNSLTPGYARAVGHLLSQNRYAILLPCHRVVPADHSIGHYRWGSERKRLLLDYEREHSHEI